MPSRPVNTLGHLFVTAFLFLGLGGNPMDVEKENEPSRFVDVYGRKFTIEIQELKGDFEERVCQQFHLEAKDVKFFFDNAVLVDGYTLEKEYPWYPCGLNGKITIGEQIFEWEITPGGKGVLEPISGAEESVCLVCDLGCEDVFPHGGNMFRGE